MMQLPECKMYILGKTLVFIFEVVVSYIEAFQFH